MEIKIECNCGSKYKFDVEPVNGRMPVPVQCPTCASDGTIIANAFIQQRFPVAAPPPPTAAPARVGGLRLSGSSPAAAVAAEGTEPADYAPAASHGPRPLLERTMFFVKERTSLLKLVDTCDILDPATGQNIGLAKEEPPTWAKWLRLAVGKGMLPTAINIYEQEGQPPVMSIRRGFTILRSKIKVLAGNQSLGYFQSKIISLGGGFNVFDNANQQVAQVKGNWRGKEFKLLNKGGREIGTVSKKWPGLGKALFTSADNYMIALTDLNGVSPVASALLLAAGLSIDIVCSEKEA